MKHRKFIALTCTSLFGSTALSQAAVTIGDVINVNFSTNTSSYAVPTGAAVIGSSGDQWNIISGPSNGRIIDVASSFALNTVTGTSSGASLAINRGRFNGGALNSSNLDVFESNLYTDWLTFELSGLSAGATVDLYLYSGAGHTSGEGGVFTIGSTAKTATDANVAETAYVEGVNYVRFSGLVVDSMGKINGGLALVSGQTTVTFAGLQMEVTNALANGTWTGVTGDWGNSANWAGGTIAHGAGKTATFDGTTAATATLAANSSISTVNFSNADHTIAAGAGKLYLEGATPSISVESSRVATISATLQGTTGMQKSGDGTLVLSGTNTYTGATSVAAGKLLINGSTASGSAVTVSSGAILGGTGTVNGAATIQSGGHLAVGGDDAPGTQTFSSTLAFESGSIFDWELDADTADTGSSNQGAYDKVVANGAVSGTSVFTIALGTNAFTDVFWNTNKSWSDIFTGSGEFDLAGIFTSFGGTGVATNGLVTGQGQFSFTSSTLTWTAVPEPTSALAGLLITAGLLRRRRAVG